MLNLFFDKQKKTVIRSKEIAMRFDMKDVIDTIGFAMLCGVCLVIYHL